MINGLVFIGNRWVDCWIVIIWCYNYFWFYGVVYGVIENGVGEVIFGWNVVNREGVFFGIYNGI